MRSSKPLRDSALLAVVGAITLVLGTLLKDWQHTLEAFGVLLICAVLSAGMAVLVTGAMLKGKLEDFVNLSGLGHLGDQELAVIAAANILPNQTLRRLEAEVKAPEIWVVTRDPAFDSSEAGESFRAVIRNNLKRGVKYTYFVPSSLGQSEQNALLGGLPRDEIVIARVPDERWRELPLSDSALIFHNPNADGDYDPCLAYFEYPNRDQLCWGRVETRKATQWADGIRAITTTAGGDKEPGK